MNNKFASIIIFIMLFLSCKNDLKREEDIGEFQIINNIELIDLDQKDWLEINYNRSKDQFLIPKRYKVLDNKNSDYFFTSLVQDSVMFRIVKYPLTIFDNSFEIGVKSLIKQLDTIENIRLKGDQYIKYEFEGGKKMYSADILGKELNGNFRQFITYLEEVDYMYDFSIITFKKDKNISLDTLQLILSSYKINGKNILDVHNDLKEIKYLKLE